MANASEILRSIFSTEDYEEQADHAPQDGDTVVTTKGSDSDNGPSEQDTVTPAEDGGDVDEIFNEDHTQDNPASVEELDDEAVPSEEEVEEMTSEIPEPPVEGDLEVTDNGPEVVESPEEDNHNTDIDVTVEVEAPADGSDVVPEVEGEGTGDSLDAGNGEAGIDPEQAIECILALEEGDIQIVKDGVQISIDEENKVSIDQSGDTGSDDSSDDSSMDDTSSDDTGSDDTGSDDGSADDGSDEGEEETSTESMRLRRIADFFC